VKDLAAELARRKAADLYRRCRVAQDPQGPERVVDGEPCLTFCSNDYLGLAGHPRVVRALQAGAERWGVGSGAAHLVSGHTAAHQALEEALAEFLGRPRALLFSTGYMANLGVIGALAGRGETLFQDRLDHASLLDGARLSGARLVRYRHRDLDDLARRWAAARRPALVATDAVFSMDGDLAPLPDLAALAGARAVPLMVDDAHGLGVLGRGGRGTLDHFGLGPDQVPILMGTLGKAFGVFGAFVAGSEPLIETLVQQARSYVYTTALPPALAVAIQASLELVRSEDWRRERLQALVARFRRGAADLGIALGDSPTPIQPLLLGSARRALAVSEALRRQGIWVPAIRPPTVPEGTARLRITFSAAHGEDQVDRLLEALAVALREAGTS